jgi:hypothetical protein
MDITEFLLRFGPALTMVVFGLHQFAKPQDWLHYLPEWFQKMSPLSPATDMRLHALGNIVFGAWLASGLFPLASVWVALIWWITVLPFAFRVSWSIGMRDLSITIGLAALVIMVAR